MTNMPVIRDVETGAIVRKKYEGSSGLISLEGLRQFGTLSIRECVLKGTAALFLIGFRVYDQKNTLLIDLGYDGLISYSREKVRKAVLNQLLNMLCEAAESQGKSIDQNEVYDKLDAELKMVYYSDSYTAILGWASELGISLIETN